MVLIQQVSQHTSPLQSTLATVSFGSLQEETTDDEYSFILEKSTGDLESNSE